MLASLQVRELAGRGRGIIASAAIAAGTTLLRCTPMSQVLKRTETAEPSCAECFGPLATQGELGGSRCSSMCDDRYAARGGPLFERIDLTALHLLHESQGRKFPLHIASLMASLLADIQAGHVPSSWAPLQLCFAELETEASDQVEQEYAALVDAFAASGVTTRQTLELLLPLPRYRRLLGAAQLNAFELQTSRGLTLSCLLPGDASCFNHSCEPNVLVSCGPTHEVSFVAGEELLPGDEACISYIDGASPDRHEVLLYKYGFECRCRKCLIDRAEGSVSG